MQYRIGFIFPYHGIMGISFAQPKAQLSSLYLIPNQLYPTALIYNPTYYVAQIT